MTSERFDDDLGDDDDDGDGDDAGVPGFEQPDPLIPEDAADAASQDSEIDFDDEVDDEIGPIDVAEAREADALLDDPERLDDEDA